MSKVGTKSKVSKHFYKDKRNAVITSDIWDRDKEYPKQFLPHVGYDYRASVGTELVSPFDGEVISVVTALWSSYGRQIFILKSDGTVTAHFAHLSRVNVKQGQKVRKGDLIGLSGGSGATENKYAPHLHLGLAKGRVTTTTKGKALGDIWLDVEEFDFEYKTKAKKARINSGAVYRSKSIKYDKIKVPTGYTNKDYDYKIEKIGNEEWVYFPNLESYVDIKNVTFTNGETPKPTPTPSKPKPQTPKKIKMSGNVRLFVGATNSDTYPTPSKNKYTRVRERTLDVIEVKGSRYKVRVKGFDPEIIWVDKTDVKGV